MVNNGRDYYLKNSFIIFFFIFNFLGKLYCQSKNQDTITIVSWNVFLRPCILNDNQLLRSEQIINYLLSTNADVLSLQEVFHKKARKKIINKLKSHYPFHSKIGRKSFFGVSSGLLTLSKHKITNEEKIYFKQLKGSDKLSSKGAEGVVIHVSNSNKQIKIINTHFQAGDDNSRKKIRKNQTEEIIKLKKKSDSIVVFTGDFNIKFNSENYNNLKRKLSSSFQIPKLTSKIKHTANFSDHTLFPSYGKPSRIDHIFVYAKNNTARLSNLRIKEPRYEKKRMSDHNPILGNIVFDKN